MQTAQNTIGQQGGPQDSGMGGYQDLDEKASQYHVTRLPERAADAAGQPDRAALLSPGGHGH